MPEVPRVTKKRMLAVFGFLVLSTMLISSCIRPPSESEGALQIGRPAPQFTLPDLNGSEISLDQYKGRVVMLDFWASWCGPCRMTMPMIENLQKKYANSLVLLTINLQEPKDVVEEYVWKQGIQSQVLLDEDGSVGEAYGTISIPMQIIIDKQGIVRFIQSGFNASTLSQMSAEIEQLR